MILPGEFSSQVKIVVKIVDLTEEDTPKYEALSYVWGSTNNLSSVHVFHARNGNATLPVTQNLATALPYLRYRFRRRTMWIDAICINQQDDSERSQQVRRMGNIYSMADRVVAWLGPDSCDSSHALSTLRRLGLGMQYNWVQHAFGPKSKRAGGHRALEPVDWNVLTWRLVLHLLQNSWFERLWVRQEMCLAKRGSRLQCGHENITWTKFCTAIAFLYGNNEDHRLGEAEIEVLDKLLSMAYRFAWLVYGGVITNLSMRDLLDSTEMCQCTEPRDRVYAIMNLLPYPESKSIVPDYSMSLCESYKQVIVSLIERTRVLDILRRCVYLEDQADWPSWVPHLDVPRDTATFPSSFPSGPSAAEALFSEDSVLSVIGKSVDRVRWTIRLPFDRQSSSLEVIQAIRGLLAGEDLDDSACVGDGSILDACCRILYHDPRLIPNLADTQVEEIEESRRALISLLSSPAKSNGHSGLSHDKRLQIEEALLFRTQIYSRSLIMTEAGYMGLAPAIVKPDDEVCILLGCNVPMLLRSSGDESFKVLGEGHVVGLEFNEGLLGALPENWSSKIRLAGDGFRRSVYIPSTTNERSKDDPRLGLLPDGWEIISHTQEEFIDMYRNIETGKETYFDPRLSSKELRKRGVELQTFNLI